MSKVYCLKRDTLGVQRKEGKRVSVMVPKGAYITVLHNLVDGPVLVDCKWNDAEIMLFATDIRERAEISKTATA